MQRIGQYTIEYNNTPFIIGFASVVGKKEGEGPLKEYFHKKLNSALTPNFNYNNLYTNCNSNSMKRRFIKKDNFKYNSSISS